ncbi:hypothetical protein [Flexivirga caeni]|uniref:hypothetical protein n=1 Tax=Flexivirga caeni TaxID=2294115 RepID=UPI0013153318|nr:hypothetical protein [Flexivirga caeni]
MDVLLDPPADAVDEVLGAWLDDCPAPLDVDELAGDCAAVFPPLELHPVRSSISPPVAASAMRARCIVIISHSRPIAQ